MGSRISYVDDEGTIPEGMWRHTQYLALHGKRGQAALRELEQALLALPEHRLIAGDLCREGEVCALGALLVGRAERAGAIREEALADLAARYPDSDEDAELIAHEAAGDLCLTPTFCWSLMQINDEANPDAYFSPEERYANVLTWVRRELAEAPACRTSTADG